MESPIKNEKPINPSAGCGFGCLHYVATVFFNLSMLSLQVLHKRRAYPSYPPTSAERFAEAVYNAFAFPAMNVAHLIWHRNAEYYAVFLIWPLNSLLFGFGLLFWLKKMRKRA